MILHLLIYLLLVLAGIVFAILYTKYITLIAVVVLSLIPILSFLCSLISSFFVKISFKMDRELVHKSEIFPLTFEIKNRSVFPIPFAKIYFVIGYPEYRKAEKDIISLSIPGRSTVNHTISLQSEYAGMLHIKIKKIKYYDIFRIFECLRFPKLESMKLVYPSMEKLEGYTMENVKFMEGESEEYYDNQSGDDPSQVYDIRDYREGDKLQRIHWKLSSKRDKLLVKEFSKPILIQNVILCDFAMNEVKLDAVKKRSTFYEKAVSLSFSFLEDGVYHYVVWYDSEKETFIVRKILGEEDMYHMIFELGEAKSNLVSDAFYEKFTLLDLNIEELTIFYVGEQGEKWKEHGIKVVDGYGS